MPMPAMAKMTNAESRVSSTTVRKRTTASTPGQSKRTGQVEVDRFRHRRWRENGKQNESGAEPRRGLDIPASEHPGSNRSAERHRDASRAAITSAGSCSFGGGQLVKGIPLIPIASETRIPLFLYFTRG